MVYKRLLPVMLLSVIALLPQSSRAQQEDKQSDQQINDFSLSGYGEKGKKSWDIAGKTADIFDQTVKLKDVRGNLYDEKEDIQLSADNGDFNKSNGKVHLEDNVVITTSGGARLTTDSLDWDRKNQLVNTPAKVNLSKEEMTLEGIGASGEPNLKKMQVDKNVRLDIEPKDKGKQKEKLVITCDGPLEVDYEKNIAIFNNNVKVERPDSLIYSDKLQVYFSQSGAKSGQPAKTSALGAGSIDKIIAQGNVRILQGENISYSQEAVYTALDKRIVLTGRPQLVIYQTEKMNAAFGN